MDLSWVDDYAFSNLALYALGLLALLLRWRKLHPLSMGAAIVMDLGFTIYLVVLLRGPHEEALRAIASNSLVLTIHRLLFIPLLFFYIGTIWTGVTLWRGNLEAAKRRKHRIFGAFALVFYILAMLTAPGAEIHFWFGIS